MSPRLSRRPGVRHQQVEQEVEIPVPMQEEEVVHVPKTVTQTRIKHQQVEQSVEIPVHMTEEEVVHVPKVVTTNPCSTSAGRTEY